ncbi:MAG: NUDIX domain-containing protein [Clostridiaceae bacterium]|nr:NUDIX domain-containing protein [Clostridiaceae bacterium]
MINNCIAGSLDDIGFVCIESKYNGKWVLCFHSRRQKWECPGGHVEKGETPLAAAKRELYEETGAVEYDIIPVWDYEYFADDGTRYNNGRVYYANIKKFSYLPRDSEMKNIAFFETLPANVTYNRDKMIDMLNKAEKYAQAHFE